jgi:hypothetical protein
MLAVQAGVQRFAGAAPINSIAETAAIKPVFKPTIEPLVRDKINMSNSLSAQFEAISAMPAQLA